MTPSEAAVLQATLTSSLGALELAPMTVDDVDAVVEIENAVYSHPWTRGNFLDSLYSGYQARTLRDAQRHLLGYFLLMQVVDEAHLLNISVTRTHQHRGLGRLLLWRAAGLARDLGGRRMLLEVRQSNSQALKVYQRYGFTEIGRRKNYYPVSHNAREGAIVMSLPL